MLKMKLDMNKLNRLIKYIRKEDVALFIGSGFSLKAGAPKVSDLIDAVFEEAGVEFAQKLENEKIPKEDLRIVSEQYIQECGSRHDLMEILRTKFEFVPQDLSDHVLLSRIPHFKTIFTTNYDTLIEDAYPKPDVTLVTSNVGCSYVKDTRVTIYKIHGDINTMNDPDSIVITERDYQNYFNNEKYKLIWEELKRTFVTKHIVFIGYSLKDDNVLEIIKNVRECVGNNFKQMFLIAPNLNNIEKRRLESNNVTYLDSYADEILNVIICSLKENIVKDYRRKLISQETFEKFIAIHGNLFTTTTHAEDENMIETIMAKQGCQKDEKIQFSISNDIVEIMKNSKYNDRMMLRGTNISVPTYKIASSKMLGFSHTINGIRFLSQEDIKFLIVAPAIEEVEIKLQMKSIGFKETVKACRYREGNTAHIDIDTPICVMKIICQQNNGNWVLNFGFEPTKTYTNNSEAIKWIDFIIGAFTGNELILDKMKISNPKSNAEGVKDMKEIKRYFELIKSIESETDIEFDIYNNYSDTNFRNALYVYHYYTGTGFHYELSSYAEMKFEIDTRNENNLPIDKFNKDEFVMIQCEPLGEFTLNGRVFNIPFKTIVFMDCVAENIKKIDEYNYEIRMKNKKTSCAIWCSDERPRQEGNILHLGNKRIA